MSLSLDTNVLVEVVRGSYAIVRERFFEALANERPLFASLIVVHELYFGCELYRDPAGEFARVREILSKVQIEPFDEPDMASAAKVRAALRKRGQTIGAYDALIAGQALARDWTVVTANKREFNRVEGLNVIDWTVPAA